MIVIIATVVSILFLCAAIWEWCMCLDEDMGNWCCRVGMFMVSSILVANLIVQYYL